MFAFNKSSFSSDKNLNNNEPNHNNNNINNIIDVGDPIKKTTDFSIDSILGTNHHKNVTNKIKCVSDRKQRPLNKIITSPWISNPPFLYNPLMALGGAGGGNSGNFGIGGGSGGTGTNFNYAAHQNLNKTVTYLNHLTTLTPLNYSLINNFTINVENEKRFYLNQNKLNNNHMLSVNNNFDDKSDNLKNLNVSRLLRNDSELIFSCNICGKVFGCSFTLEAHEKSHRTPRYECEECGKGFSQLRNYKYHISVHRGTKEFAAECPECGKVFNDKGYLSSHLKIHRNRKEYVCPHCPKSFNQRVAFNMHVRIHTGVKPHKCTECGKRFSRKMLLKQHSRTHSGEKPYQCSVCGKTFADRSNMTLHHKLHSGIKPFACPICPKAFTKKHHLKTHINYHTGCKPYVCPHLNCGQAFTQSSNMRTHAKKCQMRPI